MLMKFLIIQKVKREVPLEKWSKLLPLQFKYFEKLERQKTIEVDYHLIGHQGSMLIVSVDSDEALSKVIGEDPLFFHSEREIFNGMVRNLENAESPHSSERAQALAASIVSGFEACMDNDLGVKAAFDSLYNTVAALHKLIKQERLSVKDAKTALNGLSKVDSVLQVIF